MGTNENINNSERKKMWSSLNKGNIFSVPNNYFDTLPEKIADKIHLQTAQKRQSFILKPAFILSSLILLIGVIGFILFKNNNHSVTPSNTNTIVLSDNEIYQVIDNPELYNIDYSDITAQYLSSDIADTSVTYFSATNNEIESYLEDKTNIDNIITNEY